MDTSPTADLGTLRILFEYSDWSNRALLGAAMALTDAQLDTDLAIGPGTLRKILVHTYTGEMMWVKRWKQTPDLRWPSPEGSPSVAELGEKFQLAWTERDEFIDALTCDKRLRTVQVYRDSKGNLFQATLANMLLQGFLHSKHHQAQACNAIRRLGGPWPELDYMNRVRMPVQA
jgi:uncharacterized damage-inducible protein DinB